MLVGCSTCQQHASVSQGRICSDCCTCCHTEIEFADQTFHLTQSQYTDIGPTSPSTDPVMDSLNMVPRCVGPVSEWYPGVELALNCTPGVVDQSVNGTPGVVDQSLIGTPGVLDPSLNGTPGVLNPSLNGTLGILDPSLNGTLGILDPSLNGALGILDPSLNGTLGALDQSLNGTSGGFG